MASLGCVRGGWVGGWGRHGIMYAEQHTSCRRASERCASLLPPWPCARPHPHPHEGAHALLCGVGVGKFLWCSQTGLLATLLRRDYACREGCGSRRQDPQVRRPIDAAFVPPGPARWKPPPPTKTNAPTPTPTHQHQRTHTPPTRPSPHAELQGSLPQLPASLVRLNVSANQLSGPLPPQPLPNAFWLDFSSNRFTGEPPRPAPHRCWRTPPRNQAHTHMHRATAPA